MSSLPAEEEITESQRTVYTEASAAMRHYSGLQFAIQTLYLASIGALASAAFLSERTNLLFGSKAIAVWALGAAVMVTIFFLLLTLSCERHREHFSMKARKLESRLLQAEVADVPRSPHIGASAALKGFYVFNLLIWLLATIARANALPGF